MSPERSRNLIEFHVERTKSLGCSASSFLSLKYLQGLLYAVCQGFLSPFLVGQPADQAVIFSFTNRHLVTNQSINFLRTISSRAF
jgi:hypothetical protein